MVRIEFPFIKYVLILVGIILILLICDLALAEGDNWFCAQEASQLSPDGKTIKVCGESDDKDRTQASKWAFHEAHLEFWKTCMASSTCKGYPVSIIPGRMECWEKHELIFGDIPHTRWICRRMLTFIVDKSKEPCDEQQRNCPMNRRPDDNVGW